MAFNLEDELQKIAKVDLFKRDQEGRPTAGIFVGQPFRMDYDRAHVLVADARKQRAGGLPQGAFLLAYYEAETGVEEALLLRVLRLTPLPTERDVITSMIEYYKDNIRTAGPDSELDSFTRFEFSFSGLECRILGTFYKEQAGKPRFGADVETFYAANNYSVVKPTAEVLEFIVNFRGGVTAGGPSDVKVGRVRYSSSRRFAERDPDVPVYVSPRDFLGKRTALFGMTRTGKSNTVKKIIEASATMSAQAPHRLGVGQGHGGGPSSDSAEPDVAATLDPFTEDGMPKYPVGQIIFDVNGEYANANLQDEGTAIFEMYADRTLRYSVIPKPGFKVMKVNFYRDVGSGFDLIKSFLENETGDYVRSFLSVDFARPESYATDVSARTRYDRKVAAYLCCLKRAGFKEPEGFKVTFQGNAELNKLVKAGGLDPSKGITLDEAVDWWRTIWDNYNEPYFTKYKQEKGREWADDDLKAVLGFLTQKKTPGAAAGVSGYIKLRPIADLHTETVGKAFEVEIVEELRAGRIVIVDLSQGDPDVQRLYAERICRHLFADAMGRFIANRPNNFVQFYFEEAHNLFPKKEDKDLSQVYNRLAKEGAKLHLGMIYATQEVSSISANILKNTQNWFIAHLNNVDETRELEKYYDFADFTEGLVRFSASSDQGFVRMKTYSNPFVVPVQVDRFVAAPGAASS